MAAPTMNDFDLEPLPAVIDEVLKRGEQTKLKEFIDKVDLYLIVEQARQPDRFPILSSILFSVCWPQKYSCRLGSLPSCS